MQDPDEPPAPWACAACGAVLSPRQSLVVTRRDQRRWCVRCSPIAVSVRRPVIRRPAVEIKAGDELAARTEPGVWHGIRIIAVDRVVDSSGPAGELVRLHLATGDLVTFRPTARVPLMPEASQ